MSGQHYGRYKSPCMLSVSFWVTRNRDHSAHRWKRVATAQICRSRSEPSSRDLELVADSLREKSRFGATLDLPVVKATPKAPYN